MTQELLQERLYAAITLLSAIKKRNQGGYIGDLYNVGTCIFLLQDILSKIAEEQAVEKISNE